MVILVHAHTYSTHSDSLDKENIESIKNGLEIIQHIKPYSYSFISDSTNKICYGFLAQQVERILPKTVTFRKETKLLDYNQITPFLVKGVQELQEKIEEQNTRIQEKQDEIEELKNIVHKLGTLTGLDLSVENIKPSAILYQNTPNPFKENTVITYNLPKTFNTASIMVFDMTGELLKTYPIETENELTIEGKEFKPGMYIYSLIVNDIEVDTKKMILQK